MFYVSLCCQLIDRLLGGGHGIPLPVVVSSPAELGGSIVEKNWRKFWEKLEGGRCQDPEDAKITEEMVYRLITDEAFPSEFVSYPTNEMRARKGRWTGRMR